MRYVIKESDLRKTVRKIIREEAENEGWFKNLATAGAITAAAMNPTNANAQQTYNYRTPDNVRYQGATSDLDSISRRKHYDRLDYLINHPLTEKQLSQIFPEAYRDRNAGPEVWKRNKDTYDHDVFGRKSVCGRIDASVGKNPWEAILNNYSSRNYEIEMKKQKDNIFTLGDFDI